MLLTAPFLQIPTHGLASVHTFSFMFFVYVCFPEHALGSLASMHMDSAFLTNSYAWPCQRSYCFLYVFRACLFSSACSWQPGIHAYFLVFFRNLEHVTGVHVLFSHLKTWGFPSRGMALPACKLSWTTIFVANCRAWLCQRGVRVLVQNYIALSVTDNQ